MKRGRKPQGRLTSLDILHDLMLGGRHSRHTVSVAARVSLPTADRWLQALWRKVPGVRVMRVGHTTWYEWHARASTTDNVERG